MYRPTKLTGYNLLGHRIARLIFIIGSLTFSFSTVAEESLDETVSAYRLMIDDIICRGNKNTQCSFITNKYFQRIGEYVDPEKIADARLRLGTLFQFRNIRILLEKSTEKNYVHVVFEVEEADHIQYSFHSSFGIDKSEVLSSGYSFDIKSRNLGLSAGVTNFNFLGTGKELNLDLNLGSRKRESDYSNVGSYDSQNDWQSITLNYFDPHLFDTKQLYLNASINAYKSKYAYDLDVQSEDSYDGKIEYDNYQGLISLGRRFWSNSFAELSVSDIENVRTSKVSISYGWDSRDDLIFPTTGNYFRSSLGGLNYTEFKDLRVKFASNHLISNDLVFSYQIDYYDTHDNRDWAFDVSNTEATITLSDIDSSGKTSGKYTGWKYQLHGNDNNHFGGRVAYIHQTDELLIQFSLNYNVY